MIKHYFFAMFIFTISFYNCSSAEINVNLSKSILDQHIKKSKYEIADIDYSQSEEKLYKQGLNLLNYKYDILSAEQVFRYLSSKYPKKSEYKYYEAKANFFIGEYNYFPNIRDPYDIASDYANKAWMLNEQDRYLLLSAYILGRIGLFIRKKEGGLFSGVTELTESKDLIDRIIKIPNIADEPDKVIDSVINRGYIYTDALLTRAEVYMESPGILGGSQDSAVKLYRKVIKLKPNNMRAHILLGKYYRKKNKNDLALQEFLAVKLIAKEGKAPHLPASDQIYAYLPRHIGEIYWWTNQKDRACKQFKLHLKRRSTSTAGHMWVAICLEMKGEFESALKHCKQAVYYDYKNIQAKGMIPGLKNKVK